MHNKCLLVEKQLMEEVWYIASAHDGIWDDTG